MNAATTDKAGWLDRLDHARETWEEIVSEVKEADIERPGAMGEWTFKDVAGHLNGWRVRTVDRLEAAAHGEAQRPFPWPAELGDDSEETVDAINRWFYERYRDRPLAEILAESREQFRRLRAAVEAIPAEELVTPGRFPWLGDAPLSAVLAGSFEHLQEEHVPAIRAWLTDRSQ